MKKVLPVLIILAFVLSLNAYTQDFTYVGAAKCKMCHKSEKKN